MICVTITGSSLAVPIRESPPNRVRVSIFKTLQLPVSAHGPGRFDWPADNIGQVGSV